MSQDNHHELVLQAKVAIEKVNGDTSVDIDQTIDSMEELRDLIEDYLDGLYETKDN